MKKNSMKKEGKIKKRNFFDNFLAKSTLIIQRAIKPIKSLFGLKTSTKRIKLTDKPNPKAQSTNIKNVKNTHSEIAPKQIESSIGNKNLANSKNYNEFAMKAEIMRKKIISRSENGHIYKSFNRGNSFNRENFAENSHSHNQDSEIIINTLSPIVISEIEAEISEKKVKEAQIKSDTLQAANYEMRGVNSADLSDAQAEIMRKMQKLWTHDMENSENETKAREQLLQLYAAIGLNTPEKCAAFEKVAASLDMTNEDFANSVILIQNSSDEKINAAITEVYEQNPDMTDAEKIEFQEFIGSVKSGEFEEIDVNSVKDKKTKNNFKQFSNFLSGSNQNIQKETSFVEKINENNSNVSRFR